MTEYFERTVTRMGMDDRGVMAWAKGEAVLGLTNSLFICENGNMTQYVDGKEGENFHAYVVGLADDEFNKICEGFFEALREKDLEKMHIGLAIFSELDEYSLGSEYIKRRLMRVRISTENDAYKIKTKGKRKNFIIYKCKLFTEEDIDFKSWIDQEIDISSLLEDEDVS